MKIATMQGDGFQTIMKSVADELEIDFVTSLKTTEKLLQYSDKITPDNWCLDVKIIYGSCAQNIENGADAVFVFHYAIPVVNYGPCLLPWACDTYFPIGLKKLLPKKKFRIFSSSWWNKPFLIVNLFQAFKSLKVKNNSMVKITKGLDNGWQKVKYLDELKELFYLVGAVDYKSTADIYHTAVRKIRSTKDLDDAKRIYLDTKQQLEKFRKSAKKLPLVGISGDLFALAIDDYPFFSIEEMLIRDLKVSVYQPLSFTTIFDDQTKEKLKPYLKKTKKYIKYWVGGSDYYTIPHTFKMKDKKVDGIVHLSVFACQPEMISRSVIRMIDELEKMPPMLELTFDSHTQPEAIRVRLEAFVDMLNGKRNK